MKPEIIDPLLSCLVFLSGHYGRARSAEAVKAGLPYDERGMRPRLFCEAAERMGLKTRIVRRRDLKKVSHAVLPAVLILKNDQACVLLARSGDKATILSPETEEKRTVDLKTLLQSYAGHAIYIHPRATLSDPESARPVAGQRHWFWGPIADNANLYIRMMVAAVLINLFGLTGPLFIMNVYDRVIPNNAIETGWVLGAAALIIFIFDLLMRTLRGIFIDLAGRRIDVVASRRIYDHLLDMKLAYKPASGGAFAGILKEFDSVRDFMTSATLATVVDVPFMLFFLVVIYVIGGPVAFIPAAIVVAIVIAGLILQWPLKNAVKQATHAGENRHGLLVETITGLETVKSAGASGRLRARYSAHIGESAAEGQRSRFFSGLTVNIATWLQQSASILIVLAGMYLVRDGEMTMGALIACVILGGRALAPVGQVANLLTRYHQARSALDTIDGFMSQPSERPSGKQFLHRPVLKGKISFDRIGFSYPGTDRKVLDDINFTIEPGEKIGLIGRVGSGKSTIARLIAGLYDPGEGALYADDSDYRQIDPADLRRNVAYIAQDVVLFRGTVRENIAIARPQATEEEILQAAQASGVHDFVSRHPMGYDAQVGERGEGVSGGQRQAVALARAMLLDPAVMVCDEPTNAMDVQAETAFTKHIRAQVKDKTFILITHRQHLLSLVDRLILIDQGKVVADGERDKVLAALAGKT